MRPDILQKAERLAREGGYILVATADSGSQPHVAAAQKLELTPEGKASVTEWFCPATMANLEVNRRVSIVVWEPNSDTGYQLLGNSEAVKDLAMLDGFLPGKDLKASVPQIQRTLVIRVDRILDFKLAPHSDVED